MLRGIQTKLWKLLLNVRMHEYSSVHETDRRAGVRQVTALPPREVEAPDELQIEGMGGVKHGEAHNVGLLVHYIIQSQ